jgi:hypothetical protein
MEDGLEVEMLSNQTKEDASVWTEILNHELLSLYLQVSRKSKNDKDLEETSNKSLGKNVLPIDFSFCQFSFNKIDKLFFGPPDGVILII